MLFGKDVRLRAVERADIPTFVRWFNDPEVRRFLAAYEPMSQAKEERWFEARLDKQDDYLFAIEVQAGEQWVHVGNVGLHQVDWINRRCIFGIVVGERDYWGKGFGSEAARIALRFAFQTLNLHRVELEVFEFNRRAIRSYEKVGFRQEGVRRQAIFQDGRYYDSHWMAILRPEFEATASA